jgi:hypothetical protein
MARRLFFLVAGVAALATAVSGPAGAGGGPHAVTVTATEPLCCPFASTFVASGGIFGAQTSGGFLSSFTPQTPVGRSPLTIVRGTDTLTSSDGIVTWDFVAVCNPAPSFPGLVCDGAWHVTSEGAHGGGTLHGELNFATFTGTDTFTGNIVQT